MKVRIGEIRSVDDPTYSGMCQVRIYNNQNDEQQIKDEHLAWCTPLHPITSAATAGVGIVPSGMIVGTRVLVTYLEGDTGEQHPIIIGTLGRGDLPSKRGINKQPDEDSGGKIKKPGPDNPLTPK